MCAVSKLFRPHRFLCRKQRAATSSRTTAKTFGFKPKKGPEPTTLRRIHSNLALANRQAVTSHFSTRQANDFIRVANSFWPIRSQTRRSAKCHNLLILGMHAMTMMAMMIIISCVVYMPASRERGRSRSAFFSLGTLVIASGMCHTWSNQCCVCQFTRTNEQI